MYLDVGTERAGKDRMKYYIDAKDGSRSMVVSSQDGVAGYQHVVGGLSKVAAEQVAMALRNAFVEGARWRATQHGGTLREGNGLIECGARATGATPACGGTVFVVYPRSLDYYNYQCATCGAMTQRLTETGMSR